MKNCYKCNTWKDFCEFYSDKSKKDGKCSECKSCNKQRGKKYYHAGYRGLAVDQRRRLVYSYLLKNPCIDCGEKDPLVLEFDHVKGNKVNSISRIIREGGKLTEEMDKCVVRCANCHRRKTAKERKWVVTQHGWMDSLI